MSELAKNVELFNTPIPVERDGPGKLIGIISQAASDPNCDVGKLQKLLEMYQSLEAQAARKAYMAALAKVQTELPVIQERGGIPNKSGVIQSTYALWEDINDAIKPALQANGLALSFRTGIDGDKITVTGVLSHRDGHSEQTTIHLPSDTSGSKNGVQAVGSSTSYGKRYTASALLNITSRGSDDDGQSANSDRTLSEPQAQTIRDLITRSGADPERFCKYMHVEAVTDIRMKDYDRAIMALNLKEKKVQK